VEYYISFRSTGFHQTYNGASSSCISSCVKWHHINKDAQISSQFVEQHCTRKQATVGRSYTEQYICVLERRTQGLINSKAGACVADSDLICGTKFLVGSPSGQEFPSL
jgi:hypothetical protein